ncbi:hypothetical protein T4B_10488 [Trichinella pseudospiralis]|uniref:Uncharacterized protein n=1 Tax=Trichinella pseudospiralis TaxID=6337 RepID=A0A0V1IH02_TRIPS|nr:hypothetical protein T4B_10488 [Trichinella pseudospiralis]
MAISLIALNKYPKYMIKMDHDDGQTVDIVNPHYFTRNMHILLTLLVVILYILARELLPRRRRRFPGHWASAQLTSARRFIIQQQMRYSISY